MDIQRHKTKTNKTQEHNTENSKDEQQGPHQEPGMKSKQFLLLIRHHCVTLIYIAKSDKSIGR